MNCLLALVLTVSAMVKLRSFTAQRQFAASLRAWRLMPERWVVPTARSLSGAEAVVALLLWWTTVRLLSGYPGSWPALLSTSGATALFVILTAGVALTLRRRLEATCACFGAQEQPLRRRHLVRNVILLTAAAASAPSITQYSVELTQPAGLFLAVAVGSLIAVLLLRLDDLMELFAPSRSPAGPLSPGS